MTRTEDSEPWTELRCPDLDFSPSWSPLARTEIPSLAPWNLLLSSSSHPSFHFPFLFIFFSLSPFFLSLDPSSFPSIHLFSFLLPSLHSSLTFSFPLPPFLSMFLPSTPSQMSADDTQAQADTAPGPTQLHKPPQLQMPAASWTLQSVQPHRTSHPSLAFRRPNAAHWDNSQIGPIP